ncbi:HD domain-containing phosphohydrolase [Tepidanaerobacter sp. EBM-38]|uniref:HD domain-containing phosphohydrolase n=1 Tax=Tepidanaerobacter sp. EBM-38 TaxID=1918496 RepID=UPI000A62B8AB|nr:HD domain-containing phosphohydrolase [Tepidanaerobacter sp. EBM-38]
MIDNFARRTSQDLPRKLQRTVNVEEFSEFLRMLDDMDYQSIIDALLLVSKAKYVILNLLTANGKEFITVAMSGLNKDLDSIKLLQKYNTRFPNCLQSEKNNNNTNIIVFPSLYEFANYTIKESIIPETIKGLDIGQVVLAEIVEDDILLGNVIFMMSQDRSFDKQALVRLYIRQLGLAITQKRAEELLRQKLELNESLIKLLQYEFKSIEELLDFALNEALTITKSKLGYIFLYDEESQEVTLHSWSDSVLRECQIKEKQMIPKLKEAGIWADVIKEKKSIIINDFNIKSSCPKGHVKLSKYLSIPIYDKGKIVAIVAVANKETDYIQDDISGLTLIFNNVWTLVMRKRNEELLIKEKELLKTTLNSIEYLSYHDQLTGLYNRRFFEEELRRLDTQRNLPISVIMADVNGLKLANDAFGHELGDKLLQKAADVLKMSCRKEDIIARVGGDEFIILLPKTSEKDVKQIIERIIIASSNVKVGSIPLSMSCGWEAKKTVGDDINEVLKKAENLMYKRKLFESPSMRNAAVTAVIQTLYETHKLEEKHSKRVSDLCVAMGKELFLNARELAELRTIGLLHDIGKVAIDKAILSKSDPFTDEELMEIRRHPETGYRILSSVSDLSEIAQYVLLHHERWDGSGYPKGLKGKEIPFKSRIVAIADAYDYMTSYNPQKRTLSQNEAIERIKKGAGKEFDPELAKVFIERVLTK